MRWARADRGVASIEVVGLLPVVALVVSMILQFVAAAYTANATESAARAAARAYSLGEDPTAAARRSLPSGIQPARVTVHGPRHAATVVVHIPRFSVLPLHDVTKTVVMP
ncbi:TadE/TadG family type IV pilus assembly protein [Flexivirga alba]|uniref:TadE/TadG family type IV pilus assembly protein n=1 Tax=Flexivirga alba TaxID=702742 RepID=A0ABW2AN61_9MICO